MEETVDKNQNVNTCNTQITQNKHDIQSEVY